MSAGRIRGRRAAACAGVLALVVAQLAAGAAPALAAAEAVVPNGTLEAGGAATFDCFSLNGWGTGTPTLTAVPGPDGGRAAQVRLKGRTQGDRKLMMTENATCAPGVVAGKVYSLTVTYRSSVPTTLTLFRRTAAGWTYWTDVTTAAVAPGWTDLRAVTPVVPEGTEQVSWGLSLARDGVVATDGYAMAVAATPGTPATDELVVGGGLEEGAAVPRCFQRAGWGQHTTTDGFSADTRTGTGRSWRTSISGYVSGDRKLLASEAAGCAPDVTPGLVYTASAWTKSSGTKGALTLFRHTAAGWSYWTDVADVPRSDTWVEVTASLPPVPEGTDRISLGVSLASNGTLLVDDLSLRPPAPPPPPQPVPPAAGDLAVTGRWTVRDVRMPVRGLHTTLLRDGRVLMIAGSGNDGPSFAAGAFKTVVWDPRADTFTPVATPVDLFCTGHVTLADGRVLVMGGTQAYPDTPGAANFEGLRQSFVFDPATDSFSRVGDAPEGHWYPTLTKLEDGDVWAAGGLREDSAGTVGTEMYDAAAGRWLGRGEVPQTYNYWGTYPHMFLLDDGRMFYSGGHTFGENVPGTGARLYDWRTAQMWDVPGLRDVRQRDQAASVLLPPAQDQKLMIIGGGHTEANLPGVSTVDVVDLSKDDPAYVPGPDLPGPGKLYVNALDLPDRTVLAANGATGNRAGDVMTAATYSPATGRWTRVAADPVGRNYHSSAVLLPDGRVAVFGSNPGDGSFEQRISVYEPPYLFKGPRPVVTRAPEAVTYGQVVDLGVTGTVAAVNLTSPGSATHQTDTNARLVDVPFTAEGTTLTARVPDNPALLPPGPYMLTILDTAGAVSTATWVTVR
ncbi:galactose oxidase early set domain-containing protein [Pseudokineococcus basanitobsidens]|uniref:Galactose oxidase early set domain-containing protein n=1 Tax=Pseudokineococcus basanitobsidens TaxID=1926649 RepID=A0ABU8RLQ8_9ACTN